MADVEAPEQKKEDVDVDPRQALSQSASAAGEAPKNGGAQEAKQEDVLATLKPKAEPKPWTIGKGENSKTYVQRPLTYFAKMEWFGLVGEVIDQAMAGDKGLRIGSLFEMPNMEGGVISASAFSDADTFVQAVGKILTYAPDFLQKSYCIWLAVPDHERYWAREVMALPPDEGGLTDDEGIEIIEIFIDQNWDAVESFFRDKIMSLRDRIQSHRKETPQTDE